MSELERLEGLGRGYKGQENKIILEPKVGPTYRKPCQILKPYLYAENCYLSRITISLYLILLSKELTFSQNPRSKLHCPKGNRLSAIYIKCSGENVILRGIFHVVYHVFLYISCYIAEIWIAFLTVQ